MNVQQMYATAARIKTGYPDMSSYKTASGVLIDFKDETMRCIFLLEARYCTLIFSNNELTEELFLQSAEIQPVVDMLIRACNAGKKLLDVHRILRCWYLS